jgi:hypothetical protein
MAAQLLLISELVLVTITLILLADWLFSINSATLVVPQLLKQETQLLLHDLVQKHVGQQLMFRQPFVPLTGPPTI